MVRTITDQRFLNEFYFHYCHRGVHGKSNQEAIARKHIEVGWHPDYGQKLEICICDAPGEASIEMGWDPAQGAWPIYYHPLDGYLGECDRVALTTCVRRFLLKHGVIDNNGIFVKRGAA